MQTAEDLLSKLNEIDTILTNIQHDQFLDNCIPWVEKRKESITVLEKLKEEMDDKEGISGGLLCGGFGTAGVGSIGKVCASSAQMKNAMIVEKKVKVIIEQDEETTKKLLPFLKKFEELEKLCEETFHCSIASESFKHLIATIIKLNSYCTKGELTYSEIISRLTKPKNEAIQKVDLKQNDTKVNLDFLSNIPLNTKEFLKTYCGNSLIQKVTLGICTSCNNTVLQGLCKAVSTVNDLRSMSNNIEISWENFLLSINMFYTVVHYPTIQMVLSPIKYSVRLIQLISSSKDISKEAKKYSDILEHIIHCLKFELKTLKSVHLAAIKPNQKQ